MKTFTKIILTTVALATVSCLAWHTISVMAGDIDMQQRSAACLLVCGAAIGASAIVGIMRMLWNEPN